MRILTEQVQKLTNTSVTLKTRVKAREEPIAAGEPATGPAAETDGRTEPGTMPEIEPVPEIESMPQVGPGSEFEPRPEMRANIEPQAVDIASVVEKDPVVRALVENLGGKVVGIRRRKDGPQGETTA
jgi:hypothetical protein